MRRGRSVEYDAHFQFAVMEISAAEWKARVDLAALYRLTALYHWDDLVFTHISMRVPGPEHHFLINPYGFLFEEITASSLVKVDLAGNIVMETPYFINPAGFIIHSTVHEARQDATCVYHTHTLHGVAVSAQKNGLAMYALEAACRIQIMAQSGGSELIPVADPILQGIQAQVDQVTKGMGAELLWPALLRKLDRLDPSYKD